MRLNRQVGKGLISLFLVVSAIVIALAILAPSTPSAPAKPQKPPEQVAKEAKEAEEYAARKAKVRVLVRAIKEAARDPESVKFSSMRTNDDASVVCAEYRARNGFGGMNKEFVVLAGGKAASTATAWNKHCTGPMFDLLSAAY